MHTAHHKGRLVTGSHRTVIGTSVSRTAETVTATNRLQLPGYRMRYSPVVVLKASQVNMDRNRIHSMRVLVFSFMEGVYITAQFSRTR